MPIRKVFDIKYKIFYKIDMSMGSADGDVHGPQEDVEQNLPWGSHLLKEKFHVPVKGFTAQWLLPVGRLPNVPLDRDILEKSRQFLQTELTRRLGSDLLVQLQKDGTITCSIFTREGREIDKEFARSQMPSLAVVHDNLRLTIAQLVPESRAFLPGFDHHNASEILDADIRQRVHENSLGIVKRIWAAFGSYNRDDLCKAGEELKQEQELKKKKHDSDQMDLLMNAIAQHAPKFWERAAHSLGQNQATEANTAEYFNAPIVADHLILDQAEFVEPVHFILHGKAWRIRFERNTATFHPVRSMGGPRLVLPIVTHLEWSNAEADPAKPSVEKRTVYTIRKPTAAEDPTVVTLTERELELNGISVQWMESGRVKVVFPPDANATALRKDFSRTGLLVSERKSGGGPPSPATQIQLGPGIRPPSTVPIFEAND